MMTELFLAAQSSMSSMQCTSSSNGSGGILNKNNSDIRQALRAVEGVRRNPLIMSIDVEAMTAYRRQ